MRDHVRELLGVLQDYAPNGLAQELCSQMVNDMRLDGASDRQVDAELASAISDGIRHGNWPWTTRRC